MSNEYNYSEPTRGEQFEIQVKRFHVPGDFKIPCPKCGETIDGTLDGDSINYPTANKWIPDAAYCSNPECIHCCDNEECDEAAPLELYIGVTTQVRAKVADPEALTQAEIDKARASMIRCFDDHPRLLDLLGPSLVDTLRGLLRP